MKTIKELKDAIVKAGLTIEQTNYKGRYRISSEDGLIIRTVRFSNAKYSKYDGQCISDATIHVLKYDLNDEEYWYPMYIDAFLEDMK